MKRRLIMFAAIWELMVMSAGCIKDKPWGADLKVGDALPDFEVVMNDGSLVSDEELKGGVSVILFFHTGCPDCQKTLPVVQRIYDEYAGKEVRFAVISRAEGKGVIVSYWKENALKMPFSAQNDREVYELFASERIPRVYVNDKDGTIRYIHTDDPVPSYDDLKSEIETLIR